MNRMLWGSVKKGICMAWALNVKKKEGRGKHEKMQVSRAGKDHN